MKVRRGLGTSIEEEAEALVAEMNELLSNESWWAATKRQDALARFHEPIVKAFYDDLVARRPDSWSVRNDAIPLPTAEDGYTRAMLVGTTGAGKTSLLRHLIGSDPDKDRFPSTSTAKTTIADIEVVTDAGPYSAVVTFFSEHYTEAAIEDCILDACAAAAHGKDDVEIANALLNHRDQRFRLSYLLGSYKVKAPPSDDEWSFDESESDEPQVESLLPTEQQVANQAAIESYLERVKQLASDVQSDIESKLDVSMQTATGEDRDVLEDLFEETLEDADAFSELALDILDATKSRFELIEIGDFQRNRSGWPEQWTFESQDRNEFLEQVRGFSSNFAPLFGKLLTPLVDGIRVRGPSIRRSKVGSNRNWCSLMAKVLATHQTVRPALAPVLPVGSTM